MCTLTTSMPKEENTNGEISAYYCMKITLQQIERGRWTVEQAQIIARECLQKVDELEGRK